MRNRRECYHIVVSALGEMDQTQRAHSRYEGCEAYYGPVTITYNWDRVQSCKTMFQLTKQITAGRGGTSVFRSLWLDSVMPQCSAPTWQRLRIHSLFRLVSDGEQNLQVQVAIDANKQRDPVAPLPLLFIRLKRLWCVCKILQHPLRRWLVLSSLSSIGWMLEQQFVPPCGSPPALWLDGSDAH